MRYRETKLQDAWVLEPERHWDTRGFFARTFCAREFESHNLISNFVQCNTSYNLRRGTLRGLHYQAPPDTEAKLVRCTRGSVHDVIVDLRPGSSTFGQYFELNISAENGLSIYVPPAFAHGFQTLEDETELFYQMTNYYAPGNACGLRFDDPEIGIPWPLEVTVISEKDMSWPTMSNWKNPFEGALLNPAARIRN